MKRLLESRAALLTPFILGAALLALAACKAPDGAGRSTQTATTTTTTSNPSTKTTPASAAQPSASPADGVARITVADARREAEAGRAVFVDVRGKTEFDKSHIKGALSLPKTEAAARAAEMPRDKTLVLYCA